MHEPSSRFFVRVLLLLALLVSCAVPFQLFTRRMGTTRCCTAPGLFAASTTTTLTIRNDDYDDEDVQDDDETTTFTSISGTPVVAAMKAVIFDIDGTLADSWKLGFDATNHVLKKHGIPEISAEIYHEGTKYTTPERLARHAGLLPDDGEDDDGDKKYSQTGALLGREFDDLYIGMVTTETAGFYPGIYELLLHRIKPEIHLGALTNAAVAYAHAVLQQNSQAVQSSSSSWSSSSSSQLLLPLALYNRFSSIHGADTVPKPKPYPDGLWKVCQELGSNKNNNNNKDDLKPCECVYIGDSPSDGNAALAAGMHFIGVTWGSHSKESLLSNVVVVPPAAAAAVNDTTAREDLFTVCDTVDELQIALQRYSVLQ